MLRFTKLEGCGNDFLVIDQRAGSPAPAAVTDPKAAVALCDRRFGVGADGLLLVSDPTAAAAGALARMRVLNADGSEAEMCGNGIRCVAKFLYERDARFRVPEIPIETGAGVLTCGVTVDGRRHVTQVAVEMGRPRLERGEIPMTGPAGERAVAVPLTVDGRTFAVTAVSMGNPHAVIFVDGVDGVEPLRALAERVGPTLERHEWFPRRANIEFARATSATDIELVVWERGCGITLACGTGACATAVAACLTGLAQPGTEVAVHLLGGTLGVTVSAGYEGVTMRGPAEEVYEAEVDLTALLARHGRRTPSA